MDSCFSHPHAHIVLANTSTICPHDIARLIGLQFPDVVAAPAPSILTLPLRGRKKHLAGPRHSPGCAVDPGTATMPSLAGQTSSLSEGIWQLQIELALREGVFNHAGLLILMSALEIHKVLVFHVVTHPGGVFQCTGMAEGSPGPPAIPPRRLWPAKRGIPARPDQLLVPRRSCAP